MRRPAMTLPLAASHYLPAAFGLAASGVVTIAAVVTDTTWLAAGTFLVTAGGVLKMLYQMRIDSLKDQTAQDLRFARFEVETLKAEVARLAQGQGELRERTHETNKVVNRIGLEIEASKRATPDPDRVVQVEVVNPVGHPVPTAPQAPGADPGV